MFVFTNSYNSDTKKNIDHCNTNTTTTNKKLPQGCTEALPPPAASGEEERLTLRGRTSGTAPTPRAPPSSSRWPGCSRPSPSPLPAPPRWTAARRRPWSPREALRRTWPTRGSINKGNGRGVSQSSALIARGRRRRRYRDSCCVIALEPSEWNNPKVVPTRVPYRVKGVGVIVSASHALRLQCPSIATTNSPPTLVEKLMCCQW